nr:unnamed protein product [Callosobruchus chinensis]
MHTRNFFFSPQAVVLHTSRTERYNRTFIPRVFRAWNGLPGDVLVELLVLAYSSPASTNFPQPNVPTATADLWYLVLTSQFAQL